MVTPAALYTLEQSVNIIDGGQMLSCGGVSELYPAASELEPQAKHGLVTSQHLKSRIQLSISCMLANDRESGSPWHGCHSDIRE